MADPEKSDPLGERSFRVQSVTDAQVVVIAIVKNGQPLYLNLYDDGLWLEDDGECRAFRGIACVFDLQIPPLSKIEVIWGIVTDGPKELIARLDKNSYFLGARQACRELLQSDREIFDCGTGSLNTEGATFAQYNGYQLQRYADALVLKDDSGADTLVVSEDRQVYLRGSAEYISGHRTRFV